MVLGRNLKPGDLIAEGLVLDVRHDGHGTTFDGHPVMLMILKEDVYYGPVWSQLDLNQEYVIAADRGTTEYNNVVHKMGTELMDAAKARIADTEEVMKFLGTIP